MKFEQNIRTNDRQSSKGNQLKWENEGIWYKADYTGYEGLVEYMISHLLKKSSLAENEFVCYDLEEIKYGNVNLQLIKITLNSEETIPHPYPFVYLEIKKVANV